MVHKQQMLKIKEEQKNRTVEKVTNEIEVRCTNVDEIITRKPDLTI